MSATTQQQQRAVSHMRAVTKFVIVALFGAGVGAVFGPTLADYFGVGQPDLRYVYPSPLSGDRHFRQLGQYLDTKNATITFLVSMEFLVRNRAFRQGHVDKAEVLPFTTNPLPRIEVLGVERRSIGWREETAVEVRALLTFPLNPAGGPRTERIQADLEIRLFDNTGRQVGRFVGGEQHGREARIVLRDLGFPVKWTVPTVKGSKG